MEVQFNFPRIHPSIPEGAVFRRMKIEAQCPVPLSESCQSLEYINKVRDYLNSGGKVYIGEDDFDPSELMWDMHECVSVLYYDYATDYWGGQSWRDWFFFNHEHLGEILIDMGNDCDGWAGP